MLVAEHTPNTLNIHDGMFLILPLSKVRRTEDERQELVISQCELFKGARSKKNNKSDSLCLSMPESAFGECLGEQWQSQEDRTIKLVWSQSCRSSS